MRFLLKDRKCITESFTYDQRRPDKQAEEDSLLGVVLVQGQPYTILMRTQIDSVRGMLLTKLVEAANAGGDVQTFQESGIQHNRFRLSCTNWESYEWLCASADCNMQASRVR